MPQKGFININFAKSVVVLQTGHLTAPQFSKVKHILGETFGHMMVKRLSADRLEVSWFVYDSGTRPRLFSRKMPTGPRTPQELREAISEVLGRHSESIGFELSSGS